MSVQSPGAAAHPLAEICIRGGETTISGGLTDNATSRDGGYLAIFPDKTVRPEIKDLIVMGRVCSDLAAVKRLGASVEMTFESAR